MYYLSSTHQLHGSFLSIGSSSLTRDRCSLIPCWGTTGRGFFEDSHLLIPDIPRVRWPPTRGWKGHFESPGRIIFLHEWLKFMVNVSKKSPAGPTERTPKKPDYLIATFATYVGRVRWDSVPFNFWWKRFTDSLHENLRGPNWPFMPRFPPWTICRPYFCWDYWSPNCALISRPYFLGGTVAFGEALRFPWFAFFWGHHNGWVKIKAPDMSSPIFKG